MSIYSEIAFATASKRLCLFTGTGFSKAISDGEAPSWQGLLELCIDQLDKPDTLKDTLFPKTGDSPLSLEESAQIIQLRFSAENKDFNTSICNQISAVTLAGDNSTITDFLTKNPLKVITTNYDKLIEQLISPASSQSISPGLPIPRSTSHAKVYHVHGSIDSPKNMVVTSQDYFEFMNKETYFSRKLNTILYENTVVILGYSLSDTNLKAIINNYKSFSDEHFSGGNLFFISKDKINQHLKDYYSICYGIRVIDKTSIHEFFRLLSVNMQSAEKAYKKSKENIEKVLLDNHAYTDDYLKVESSLPDIIASLFVIGKSLNDDDVVALLAKIIEKKKDLTCENNAWDQYTQLAIWLTYIASIVDLNSAHICDTFLSATLRSMNTMSKSLTLGYSWHAYNAWAANWTNILPNNRQLIKDYIMANTGDADAHQIVSLG